MEEVFFLESNLTGYGAAALTLARQQGYRTHFVARNPVEYRQLAVNPAELADQVSTVDSYDVPKLLHFFASQNPRAVVAFDDYRLIASALVGQFLGLPHTGAAGLVNTHFKDRTRARVGGIGGHVEAVLKSLADPGERAPLPYPCVVKPIDDSGSTGVRVVHDDAGYAAAVAQIAARPVNLRDYTCAPLFLVEEFIDGPEFTAEVMWDNQADRWRLIGFTKKLMAEPPYRVELGAMFPYLFGGGIDQQVEEAVYGWLAAVEHRHGAAHVEFKLRDGIPTLIEINPRLGGDQIRELMMRTYGFDAIAAYLDLHLGKPTPRPSAVPDGGYATSYYLTPPRPGLIERVLPPPDSEHPGIVRSALTSKPFQAGGVRDNDDRLGYVISHAPTFEDSLKQAEQYMSAVELVYSR